MYLRENSGVFSVAKRCIFASIIQFFRKDKREKMLDKICGLGIECGLVIDWLFICCMTSIYIPENCPKCKSNSFCKNGFNGYRHEGYTNRKQRYLCLTCGYNFTLAQVSTTTVKNWGYSPTKRKNALTLYKTNKFTCRGLAKRLKINEKTLRNWIQQEDSDSADKTQTGQ